MSTVLPLQDMHMRHRGLTAAIAANNTEAATVCLSRHLSSPAIVRIESNPSSSEAEAAWAAPDVRTVAAWNNRTDATEMGAYACVIAALELARCQFAVRRAETGTGADYYVGPTDAGVENLEDCFRLEVSGVDDGGEREVRQRVLQKAEQARRGNSSLPAIVGVVGFAARLVVLADVETP